MTAMSAHNEQDDAAMAAIQRMINTAFFTLVPLTLLSVVVTVVANSLTIFSIALDCLLSLIVSLFSFIAIRTMRRQNVFEFPYGTGKLENFTSFLYGALLTPTSILLGLSAIQRYLTPPVDIMFELSQVPVCLSLIRSVGLCAWARHLKSRAGFDSPLLHSLYVNYKVAVASDVGIILALGVALGLERIGEKDLALTVDPVTSMAIAFYMASAGITLLVHHFKALIDLPLPERDQLKIMAAVAHEYEHFENIGQIFSRVSGKTRVIELEMEFKARTAMDTIAAMELRMENELKPSFPSLVFRIIPRLAQVSGADPNCGK